MAYQDSSNSWVFDIQDTIYSRLDAVCTAKLSSKYPDLNVTTDSHKITNAKFPNVYLHFLSPIEVGKDLDRKDVNAIYLTAEISVTVTSAQKMEVAREVTQIVVDCMKEMRFTASLSEFVDTDTEYRTVSRFARTIGNEEKIF